MSIKKQVIKTKPVVKVTFSIEAKEASTAAELEISTTGIQKKAN